MLHTPILYTSDKTQGKKCLKQYKSSKNVAYIKSIHFWVSINMSEMRYAEEAVL